MALETSLNLNLQQKLTMTPRLQQSIQMLQMTVPELSELIEEELLTNPTIEQEEQTDKKEEKDSDENKIEENSSGEDADFGSTEYESTETNIDDKNEVNWEEYFDNTELAERTSTSVKEYGETINYENMVARDKTLHEHLLMQLRLNTFSLSEFKIGEFLIGNIDSSGYIRITVEEASRYLHQDIEEVTEILELIQSFDPYGVGARDLRECLLNQYKLSDDYRAGDIIEVIISDHLEEISVKNFKEIGKKLKVPPTEVQDVLDYITEFLDPKPGLEYYSDTTNEYIKPDVLVEKVNGKYKITLNDSGVPRIIISNKYKLMLKDKAENSKETRQFIKQKLDSAKWLIDSIMQRRDTIFKVATAIVEAQEEFLESGVSHFKPLTLKDIAFEINMHESTVSRVTTGKYMQTPRGVFEFKYFFSSSLPSRGSESGDVSSIAVKFKIKTHIENENTKKPLSDQKIVEILKEDGIKIARRTVAKYREELNILSSSKRKRYE